MPLRTYGNVKAAKSPIVSVLVPVFNGEDYLENALASIEKQTFQSFEVIVIDDGSDDNECIQGILSRFDEK
jgi:glycosyltransferase involved in cell wall biosynthesis